MEITLSDKAIHWFETKFPLNEGEAVRFFGKLYGKTEVHDGFSLGLQLDDPERHDDVIASIEVNDRTYFTTQQDAWFFNGYDLAVDLNEDLQEPSYHFNPEK